MTIACDYGKHDVLNCIYGYSTVFLFILTSFILISYFTSL